MLLAIFTRYICDRQNFLPSYLLVVNRQQDAVVDGSHKVRPDAATWRTRRNTRVVFDSDLFAPLYKNMTSSTKPEIRNISHSAKLRLRVKSYG